MHGIHQNHGHHLHTHGLHSHGEHGAQGAQGGPQTTHSTAPQAAPAAQDPAASAPATQAQAPQQPSMGSALAALDQAIQSLTANFHKDSFNGQAAPTNVAQPASTLTNAVGDRNNDMFLSAAGASAPAAHLASQTPAATATPVSSTLAAGDPLLALKGGGGPSGGVLGDRSYLNSAGGGGPSGGVLGDRSRL